MIWVNEFLPDFPTLCLALPNFYILMPFLLLPVAFSATYSDTHCLK